MRRNIRSLATAAGISAALLTGTASAQDVPGVTKDEIRIGTFGPFTGPNYIFGKLVMNGIEAVFDETNEAGGIHGRKLVLVRQDDECKPEGAIAAAKKLIYEAKVFALNGGACSNATIAAVPEFEKAGIPVIINAATADPITDPVKPSIFTMMLTASIESRAQVDHVLAKGAKRVAVVRMTDAWGDARWRPLAAYAEQKGLKFVENVELGLDANDATPQVLKLRAARADAVLMVLFPKPGAVLIRDAQKLGYDPDWIGQTGINDLITFTKQVGSEGALAKFVTMTPTRYQTTDPEMKPWVDRIRKLFPNDDLSTFNLNGIGSAQVLVEALKRAGPEPTQTGLIKALESIKNMPTSVYAGPITCGEPPNPHQCNRIPGWLKLADGKPTIIR